MSSIKNWFLKKPLVSAIAIASVMGVGLGAISWKTMNPKIERVPASFKTSKSFSPSGKINRPFDIAITSNLSEDFSENTEVTLDAKIVHLRTGLREIYYKWILPEGVKV